MAYNVYGKLCDDLKEEGMELFQITMKHPFDLKAAKKLSRFVKENKIDIIHAQYPRENNIAVLSRLFYKKVKVLMTVHLTLSQPALWKNLIYRMITPFNAKIICVCNMCKDIMQKCGVKEKKLEVVFNGIEPIEKAKVKPSTKNVTKIDHNAFILICAARFSPEKGLFFLIDSIKELKKITDRKFQLLLVGAGELFDEIKTQVKTQGLNDCVTLTGYRQDLNYLLSESNVFINSSSSNEAFSFAILEALAEGLPVIATNIGGNPDIINKKTDCGILVNYGNTRLMAEAIKRLMEDKPLYERYKKNAKIASEHFSQERMLDNTYSIYNQTMEE